MTNIPYSFCQWAADIIIGLFLLCFILFMIAGAIPDRVIFWFNKRYRPRIKCAAIRYNGHCFEGSSHAEIGHRMIAKLVCKRPFPGGDAQGFMTNYGEFVDRHTALQIAKDAGQVHPKTYHGNGLFSEDLKKSY